MRRALLMLTFLCALLAGWIPVAASVHALSSAGLEAAMHAPHGHHGAHQASGEEKENTGGHLHPAHCAACLALAPSPAPHAPALAAEELGFGPTDSFDPPETAPATPPPRS